MDTNILRFFHAPIRFTTFITLYCNISDKDKRCMLRYKRLSNLIELFERKNDVKIYTTSFDRETIGRFVRFLDNCISERTHRHYLRSTIISFMDVLKSLLNIAKDMNSWIVKIKDYTEYMSDIITTVKGQAVNLSNEEDISFTIEELLKRVNILMKHELKNAIIYLNISLKTDENTIIHGDVNSLVQVINNMVSNSIQAYEGKTEQTIDLIVEKEDNNLLISIKDYASGLPDKVKEKLFKEMITTKGKNGTGLGLYMSYSTIKAHFNGNITVDSELGKGTTFTITLPLQ